MHILDIVLLIFIVLESMNVLIIYCKPEFPYGNGLAVFKQWEDLKSEENTKLFAKYMANWVAGSKLIFIVLLIVILITGSDTTKLWALIVMIPAIGTYYVKLHPIIKKIDHMGEIIPKGYSKTLLGMISGFLCMFIVAILIYLL